MTYSPVVSQAPGSECLSHPPLAPIMATMHQLHKTLPMAAALSQPELTEQVACSLTT